MPPKTKRQKQLEKIREMARDAKRRRVEGNSLGVTATGNSASRVSDHVVGEPSSLIMTS